MRWRVASGLSWNAGPPKRRADFFAVYSLSADKCIPEYICWSAFVNAITLVDVQNTTDGVLRRGIFAKR